MEALRELVKDWKSIPHWLSWSKCIHLITKVQRGAVTKSWMALCSMHNVVIVQPGPQYNWPWRRDWNCGRTESQYLTDSAGVSRKWIGKYSGVLYLGLGWSFVRFTINIIVQFAQQQNRRSRHDWNWERPKRKYHADYIIVSYESTTTAGLDGLLFD